MDHYVIKVPKLTGYKTLIVNAVVILWGVLSVLLPKLGAAPDAGVLSILVDQAEGALIAVIGLVNMILRLLTTTPAAPMRKPDPSGFTGGGYVLSGDDPLRSSSLQQSLAALRATWDEAREKEHAAVLNDAYRYGAGVALSHVPYARVFSQHMAAKTVEREPSDDPCAWPDCACHQRCELYRGSVQEALDADLSWPEREPAYHEKYLADISAQAEKEAADERLNSEPAKAAAEAAQRKGGILHALAMIVFIPIAALGIGGGLAGCAQVQQISAVAQAETLEQRAFALYGTFVVLEERAADIVEDARVPKDVRKRIVELDRITKPAADIVLNAAKELANARTAYQKGQTTAEKVAALSTSLAGALATLQPRVTAFVQLIEGART